MNYPYFFKKATGNASYPYQATLAEADEPPALLRVPTGAGKTEAAILGWLYKRFKHPDNAVRAATPRRLVYCLPMRTLVEQTVERVGKCLENLGMEDDVSVITLMGGEPRSEWHLEPEKPAIVIGTQDMLLSRALNRGYGNSPFMWPVEYGLLNNDCLWVMDEVQLMENGLPTSTQLAGLRRKLETFGPARSMWMSATVRPDWLGTIDHPAPSRVLELGPDDLAAPNLSKRHTARKIVAESSSLPSPSAKNYVSKFASLIADRHEPGTLTLAILNTVGRAQQVYEALYNLKDGRRPREVPAAKILVHSRFRQADRQCKNAAISKSPDPSGEGMIVVATQAVEAGVDISARTLITELAPWPSMVQRFGRCNRAGEFKRGDVFWVNVNDNNAAPYEREALQSARELMQGLKAKSVGPADLEALSEKIGDAPRDTVIRRRDVIGLFDTTPDLSGSYLDVSQYVRGGDESHVTVFWRDNLDDANHLERPKPAHDETVNVPIGELRDFLRSEGRRAWTWDFLDDQLRIAQPYEIYPGMTIAIDSAHGGYSADMGWLPSLKEKVAKIQSDDANFEDGLSSDPNSTAQPRWVTLANHSRNVEEQVRQALDTVSVHINDPTIRAAVETAALFHDSGKAHCAFQTMLRDGSEDPPPEGELLAKSPGGGKMAEDRRHFRHEVGSALAILQHARLDGRTRDLAAYLAASHHGKVRLAMRSMPGDKGRNPVPNRLLGYSTDLVENLPSVDLGDGLSIPKTELDMAIAQIGDTGLDGRSWIDRTLGLLEWLGPFRLAYLEAIVRAADMRASKYEREGKL